LRYSSKKINNYVQ